MHLLSRKQCLLLSFAATIAFLAIILLFMPVQYQTNDDPNVLSFMAGYRTGVPIAHELGYTTIGLGIIVSRLYILLPMFPWYTIVHLFMLWLSSSMICFCILDSGRTTKRAFWISSVCSLVFLVSIYLYASTMLQFTDTPAIAGGAAIVLLLHYRRGGRRYFIITLLVTTLLLGFCYSMRPNAFYISAALFACVAVVQFIIGVNWRRHIALFIAVPFAAVALLYIVNTVSYDTPEYKAYLEYEFRLSKVMDYPRPAFDAAPDVYTNAGLNKVEADLLNQWCFLFYKVDARMLTKLKAGIDEYYRNNPEKYPGSGDSVIQRYSGEIRASKYNTYCFWLIISLACVILITPAYAKPRKEDIVSRGPLLRFFIRNSSQFIAIGIIAFFFLSDIYFTRLGRFPDRVYLLTVLLSAPPLFLLAARSIQNRVFPQFRSFVVWSAALLVVSSVLAVRTMDISALNARKTGIEPVYARTLEYATEHPENTYFTYMSGTSSMNPFTVFPHEKPVNWVHFNGMSAYSPFYYKQLALNGFDRASQELLLDSRAYYITLNLAAPLVEYYKFYYPEYEFTQVDDTGGFKVYKLMPS